MNKKMIRTVAIFLAIVILAIVVWNILCNTYFLEGEWEEVAGSSGRLGENTYYDSGAGEEIIYLPGTKIVFNASISNSGSVKWEIYEYEENFFASGYNFEGKTLIDTITIYGTDSYEYYLDGTVYDRVIIHEFTDDYAEGSTSTSVYRFITNYQKFGRFLNNMTLGIFSISIEKKFDL